MKKMDEFPYQNKMHHSWRIHAHSSSNYIYISGYRAADGNNSRACKTMAETYYEYTEHLHFSSSILESFSM